MQRMKNIQITSQRDAVPYASVAKLYESVGFGDAQIYMEDSDYKAAYNAAGSIVFLALDSNGNLIGMIRGFTDKKICTWVAELCVHPEWQRQAVGSSLIEQLIKEYGHTAIYVDAFSGTENFYIKHGIKPKTKLVACSRAGSVAEGSSSFRVELDITGSGGLARYI